MGFLIVWLVSLWQVSGSLQHESLFPTVSVEGDRTVPRADWAAIDHLSNTYLDASLRYTYDSVNAVGFNYLTASVRGELLQWPLLGYEADFQGYGLSHLSIESGFRWGSVTLGDIYGQFGSGLILRLYEERSLGIDNPLRGAKIDLRPYTGIHLTALGGKQRRYWNCYRDHAFGWNYSEDAAVGADLELSVDSWSPRLQEAGAFLQLGGSYVSKYQRYSKGDYIYPTIDGVTYQYNLPEWVGAGDLRAAFQMQGWNALIEYAYKANDPGQENGYSYRPGQALLSSLSYSRRGMSVLVQVKRSENMGFRSDRALNGIAGTLNNLPAFTTKQTYALPALYPYATQTAGEWAFQAEGRYTWRRNTPMGGRYGTTLKLQGAHVRSLAEKGWGVGHETYYTDANLELQKRLAPDWWLNAMVMYQTFNKHVVQGHGDLIRSGIGVVDVKWATTDNIQMRTELQYLYSRQDQGQWIYALYELSVLRELMLSFSEQYCIGHGAGDPLDESEQGNHYYSVLATWLHKSHRLSAGYTKTRAGYNCAGGVCRYIPRQEGVTVSYSMTF